MNDVDKARRQSEGFSGPSPAEGVQLSSFLASSNSSVRVVFFTPDDGLSLKMELTTTHDNDIHSKTCSPGSPGVFAIGVICWDSLSMFM